jgi:hypothetical protein
MGENSNIYFGRFSQERGTPLLIGRECGRGGGVNAKRKFGNSSPIVPPSAGHTLNYNESQLMLSRL